VSVIVVVETDVKVEEVVEVSVKTEV
jgi:hypothetical protein